MENTSFEPASIPSWLKPQPLDITVLMAGAATAASIGMSLLSSFWLSAWFLLVSAGSPLASIALLLAAIALRSADTQSQVTKWAKATIALASLTVLAHILLMLFVYVSLWTM
jgi:hypothetical protein